MFKYTVIGLYEDNGQVVLWWIDADDAHDAMAQASRASDGSGELVIVGAILGKHGLTPPSEDSGKSAYAIDLATVIGS